MTEIAELGSQLAAAEGLAGLPVGAQVLVIRLRSMGDTVLMTPALRLLHDWRPDLQVSVLAESPWDEILEGNPAIHSVIPLRGKLRTAYRIWREKFAAVVNLHGGPTSAFLTRSSRAKLRAGFDHFRHASAYNLHAPTAQEVLRRKGAVHTAEHAASFFFWLGVPPAEIPSAEIFPSPTAIERMQARLRSQGIEEGEEYAVLHPSASYASKQWRIKGFAEVGDYLDRKFGLRSVFACSRAEAELLDELEYHMSSPFFRAVGWPIRELVALTAGARIFVGNDSGPAHIAAAARIPVLVIFGSSHAAVWGPWKAVNSAIVQNYFDCNPCPGDRCYVYDEPRCILSITTEQAKVYLDALLRPPSSRPFLQWL
ncbi:MAG: glycosyltransferase family 9 protein [Acidobacteria bacterium]|nr:glycosyltransferase family 9 protein [Acidobacteriota bacterium]